MAADLQSLMKRKQPLFDGRTILFLLVAVIMFAVLVFLMIMRSSPAENAEITAHWTPAKQFKYANMLSSKGLKGEALSAYEKYLGLISASPVNRAKVAYQMGNIYMELGQYEKALSSFYRVDMENPGTELAGEVGQKVVACLERLGMTSQARYELESRTAVGKKEADDTDKGFGPIIARIGKEEVRMSAINEAMDQLPEWTRKQYESDEGKIAFVRQYIANELLYRKAKRMGYEVDPDVRVQFNDLARQVLVQRIVMQEAGKVIIDPRDVQLYYNAYKDKYAEKAKFKLSMLQVDSKSKAEKIVSQVKLAKSFGEMAKSESLHKETKDGGGEINNLVTGGGYIASGVGNSPQVWAIIGKTSQGMTDVVEVNIRPFQLWLFRRIEIS